MSLPSSSLLTFARGEALPSSRLGMLFALMLLLLAATLRLTDIATLPQGFSDSEIVNIRLKDNVRQGDILVFYPAEAGGIEGLYHALGAFATALISEGTIGYRMLGTWLSLLSIAILYTLGHHLFNPIVGLMAASLVTINMSSILLARTISNDAVLSFLASVTMLSLARSLPVYRRRRIVTSNNQSFSMLGILLGGGLYLHSSSLFILLGALSYIAYLVFLRDDTFRQNRSYTGFALLLLFIISVPYIISSINLPQYAAFARVLPISLAEIPQAALDGLLGIVLQGDSNPAQNLPSRPMLDVASALFLLLGLVVCLRRRHSPRFMLLLILFAIALPAALFVPDSPNFARMSVLLPYLALFFGIGFYTMIRQPIFRDAVFRQLTLGLVLLWMALNVVWTWQSYFVDWRNNPAVLPLVNGNLGQIAHYFDRTGDEPPVVICNPSWGATEAKPDLSLTAKTLLMMNRTPFAYHEANCSRSLLLTNGGSTQRIVFFSEAALDDIHPYLQDWLAQAQTIDWTPPRHGILQLEAAQQLASRAGALTTTAPLSYAPEVSQPAPIAPPIRFGGNLTFLGYEPNVQRDFLPGDTVEVITYWRVEGELLPDITLKTHILSSPVTAIAIRDILLVNPVQMQGRDVFIQITEVPLPKTALPGERILSIGAYRQNTGTRLPVLEGNEERGNRIFLYSINVLPTDAGEGEG